ncbi:MAG: tRNA pseudouridine(38-40) synthase TruA [Terriglobales bacterium]|jgi:tRNA pseudouridine38-40 synthase
MARNIKLVLAYDGTDYHGWQMQPNRPTIQSTLHRVLWRVLGGPTQLPEASGRTDAGVHALGQVVTFRTDKPIPAPNLLPALNDVLPADIRVLSAEEVPPDFHPRDCAKAKTYRYRLLRTDICPPFVARFVTHYPYPLDEAAMLATASLIEGEHDFTSFAAVDPEKGLEDDDRSKVRTIFSSRWRREGDELIYEVRGSGFLHHMVRNLVGTFLLLGKGTISAKDLKRILDLKDRSAAGPTVGPEGLYLVNVEY